MFFVFVWCFTDLDLRGFFCLAASPIWFSGSRIIWCECVNVYYSCFCHVVVSVMSLCQKVLGEDHPFLGCKCFFRFKFSLQNKPNFIRKSMHQRDNKDKLDSQSQFGVSIIWKFTPSPSPGWKSAKEGWTFRVHRFSCRFVCIFLLQIIFLLLPDRT